jgi:hypothetical protein
MKTKDEHDDGGNDENLSLLVLHGELDCDDEALPVLSGLLGERCAIRLRDKLYVPLVGYPYVATTHNNTHVNYPPKRSQDFLLVVSSLRIIFFMNAQVP